jgi:hypothetical protein
VKLYLFLRSIIWTSILSVISIIGTLVAVIIATPLAAIPFGLTAIALAVLSLTSDRGK